MKPKSWPLRKSLILLLILVSFSIGALWPRIDVSQASPTTTYYVDPPSIIDPALTPGSTFTVDVNVSEASYMYSWQVYMGWDSALLETSVADVVFGGFLADQPEGSMTSVDVRESYALVGEGTIGKYMGKTADEGLLFTITFSVKATGETTLDINHTILTYYYEMVTPPMSTKITDFPKENGYFSNTAERQWTLNVNSEPISGIEFTLDGAPHTTSWSDLLDEGSYTIVMPSTWTVGADVYNFDHWDDMSTDPTRTISLTEDMTVTAYYEYVPETHTLTVNSDPITGVEFTIDGATHTTPWSDSLPEGTYTIIMPSTSDIYDFDRWEDMSTNPTRTVSLTADKTVTAYYVKRQWTLNVNSDPIDGVEFTLDGAPHTTSWSDLLDEGSYTIVMPSTWTVGADVYNFDHWDDMSTDPTRTISLTEDMTVTAYYVLSIPQYELIIDVVGNGTTVPSPSTYIYDAGTEASVAAVPDPGYMLDHWELDGEDKGDADPYSVTMNANHTLIAFFVKIPPQYELTVNSDPITGVEFTLDGVTHATPWSDILDEGSYTVVMPSTWTVGADVYNFNRWDSMSTDPNRTISLTEDMTVTAYYVLAPKYWTLTVDSDPIDGVEFTVDGVTQTTPYSDSLEEGTYTVVMPSSWGIYDFDRWEDASTDPTRIISLTDDVTVTAYYVARQWTLSVQSDPISGIDFTVDGATHATSWSSLLDEGSYTVVMPSTWTVGTDVYNFDHWDDASTDPTRTVTLTSNIDVTAYYTLAPIAETVVAVDPPVTTAEPGQYFTINVTIANVTDLYSWGARIKWPAALLNTHKTNVTEGPFLQLGGSTSFTKKVYASYVDVGSTLIGMVPGVTGSGTLVTITFKVLDSGNCTLKLDPARTTFYNSSFILIDITLQDGYFYTNSPVARFSYEPNPLEYYGRPIVGDTVTFNGTLSYDPDEPYDTTPGGITSYQWDFGDDTTETGSIVTHIYDEPGSYIVTLTVTDDEGESGITDRPIIGDPFIKIQLHDIAVINVTVTPTTFTPGTILTINVTVLNKGSVTETLNVTVYKDLDPVKTVTFLHKVGPVWTTSLLPDKNGTTTIEWDTTGISPGDYTLKVYAFLINPTTKESVPGIEKDEVLPDNWMTYGTITALEEERHDIAVKDIKVDPTDLKIDEFSNIEVTIENEGNVDEQYNATLTIHYGPDLFTQKEWSNQTLTAGATAILELKDWLQGANTTKEGEYNVTVVVILVNATTLEEVPDDDPTDNTLSILANIRMFPVAYFTYSPTEPSVEETVTFNATGSYAPGIPSGTIEQYSWDFGDGASDSGVIVTHAYIAAGTYTITLTVTDNDGLTDTTTHSITISPVPGTRVYVDPPISFAMPGETFTIDIKIADVENLYSWQVNMSFDPSVLEFVNVTEGEFLKDQPEGTWGPAPKIEEGWVLFGWSTVGKYSGVSGSGTLATVEYQVEALGESMLNINNTLTKLFEIVPPPVPPGEKPIKEIPYIAGNGFFINLVDPPTAEFTFSPSLPGINELINFDASASYATPPREIVRYEWAFGDGTTKIYVKDVNLTDTTTHAYAAAGTYTVTLTVIDNASATDLVQAIFGTTTMPRIWYELYSTRRAVIEITELPEDVTPPTITINEPVAKDYLHSETITLDFNAVDTESGVASISATLDGKTVESGESIELFTLSLGQHTLTITAVDNAENSATETVEFNVIATIDSLMGLIEKFYDLGYIDEQGVESGLLDKLYAAQKKIETGKVKVAKKILNAFINQLKAQSGKHIAIEAADILLTDVQHVIDNL